MGEKHVIFLQCRYLYNWLAREKVVKTEDGEDDDEDDGDDDDEDGDDDEDVDDDVDDVDDEDADDEDDEEEARREGRWAQTKNLTTPTWRVEK